MNIPNDQLIKVLSQFNPWWRGEGVPDLPPWQRAAFHDLYTWVHEPPAPRAVLLSGARQVGKTTLLLQVINHLLSDGVPSANILYATFDHPIIKMAGIDAVLAAWREREPSVPGLEYLFLDEAQSIHDLGTWVKHHVDFEKNRRIIFTGSAMPLIHSGLESGVGRWHNIKLTTLSFYEYIQLKLFNEKSKFARYQNLLTRDKRVIEDLTKAMFIEEDELSANYKLGLSDLNPIEKNNLLSYFINMKPEKLPKLPSIKSLIDLFEWSPHEFRRVAELTVPYVGHFHEYLVRGGFPQTAQIKSITQAQRLLREDIIDKVLKRDMTALFGVRHVLELEQTFLYLCMHDGGLLDMPQLCKNLEIKRPTAQHFIDLLEASHLIYRLQPFGYGKEILRGKYKIYLADAAISSAVLLKGKAVLDNSTALGIATETAVFKHLYASYYPQSVRFSYWRGSKKDYEVDLVAEIGEQIIPFEVKYRTQDTGVRELKGLLELCQKKSIKRAYVVTKSLDDFGVFDSKHFPNTKVMRIPAPLLCYWMGELEQSQSNSLDE